ncbi:hypothetical protein U5801_18985 [Lamprobacter modestohalophilus]|uniref:hypothetical protein n=1 Tax=Lamprobacter modestohalophilus TaxID=1064514 RepID=UPI002ADEE3AC|nr:hypothetical protein [Lamprobacter modestohalophilus]MEA1051874.1 hypothetical protein [Lamprobacter modestohalophilus]
MATLLAVSWTVSLEARAAEPLAERSLVLPDAATAWYQAVHVWQLGDWSNEHDSAPDHLWLVFHGDIPKYYRTETAPDRSELDRRLGMRRETALLVYPISSQKDWGGARSVPQSMSLGQATFALIEALSASYGDPDWAVQTFTFSGAGRVDLALQRFILSNRNAQREDNMLANRVNELISEHLTAMSAGDAMVSRSMEHPRDIPNSWIRFLKTYPDVSASFVHDRSSEYPYMFGLASSIGQAFDPGFKLHRGESKSIGDGRLRFWAGETHRRAWIGQFSRVFLPDQF